MDNGPTTAQIISSAPSWRRYEDAVTMHCGQEDVIDVDFVGTHLTHDASRYAYFVQSLHHVGI